MVCNSVRTIRMKEALSLNYKVRRRFEQALLGLKRMKLTSSAANKDALQWNSVYNNLFCNGQYVGIC